MIEAFIQSQEKKTNASSVLVGIDIQEEREKKEFKTFIKWAITSKCTINLYKYFALIGKGTTNRINRL